VSHVYGVAFDRDFAREIILPNSAYSSLLEVSKFPGQCRRRFLMVCPKTFNSRNFLDWMIDFETKLRLKTISSQLMSIAVAKNVLIEQVFDLADREVERTPICECLRRMNCVVINQVYSTKYVI
jgi:hypothetical protein